MNTSIQTNPIAEAIAPQKTECVDRAEKAFINYVENTIKPLLAEHGYDINKAAPRPSGMRDSRASYVFKQNFRAQIQNITESANNNEWGYRKHGDPELVRISEERYARAIEQVRKDAGASFDAYVAKLTAKIGAGPVEASVVGRLWDYSILTVTMADGSIQKWRTQQILNVSCLGKVFNQWPTRRMKDKAKK
jgi:hypothetical protein